MPPTWLSVSFTYEFLISIDLDMGVLLALAAACAPQSAKPTALSSKIARYATLIVGFLVGKLSAMIQVPLLRHLEV
jgi:predicted ABC-type sugar transport system permease subunit